MAFYSRSRLFGLLLIMAALPLDLGAAMATGLVDQRVPGGDGATAATPAAAEPVAEIGSVESRLQRIAAAVRDRQLAGEGTGHAVPEDALAVVFVNGPGMGWANGGFRNGGFYNGGFRNGGFYNGGFRNGGFYNGGFRNGGFGNGW